MGGFKVTVLLRFNSVLHRGKKKISPLIKLTPKPPREGPKTRQEIKVPHMGDLGGGWIGDTIK
jgi:hypothetical protein